MEGDKPGALALQAQGRKFSAYKLIVDPALVKGALKLYRFDGVIPGDNSSPNILPRDPRKQKSLRCNEKPMVLPVPAFEVDKNYVGVIPPTEITLRNLNDNVSEIFLRLLCMKFGIVEDVRICLHPISHRHLGFGHVVFKSSRDAKTCVEKLNGNLVMGQKVNVFHDPGGQKCKELFIEVTTQKPRGRTSSVIKVEERSASNSFSSTPIAGTSIFPTSGNSSTSTEIKHAPSISNSKESHMGEPVGYFGNHYKEESRYTPHDGAINTFTEDRKPSHPAPPSTKVLRRPRDKVKTSEDGFKRANSMYEIENYNYGYPIQHGSSSKSTPSASGLTTSSPSSYHQHHYDPSQYHQENSFLSSSQINSNSSITDHHQIAESCENSSSRDKVFEKKELIELSPKINLDTRIKIMLEKRNSGEFGKLFTDGNIKASGSESESDTEASPLKRARLSLGHASAKIWDSESDEEEEVSKETSFAKKFKQSFVPLGDGAQVVSSSQLSSSIGQMSQHLHNSMSSSPPSPFLTSNSSSATKSFRVKADPEFPVQISNEDDDQGVGGGGGSAAGDDKDDMSLSSLSPGDASGRIRQSRFSSAPPPGQVNSAYYGEYYNNNTYSSNYQMSVSWGSHHHQQLDQPQYNHNSHHHQQQHHAEYQGNYQAGYSDSYEHQHHRAYHPNSSYPPPSTHSYPEKPEEMQRPPTPLQEDHKNPNLLIKAVFEVMVDDLKKVLRRDCNRRLIETEAFKMYEDWWDKQAHEFKRKQDEENAKNLPTSSTVLAPKLIIQNDTAGKAVVETETAPATSSVGSGLGIGLRNAIPKLPSFRRNVPASEPGQDEDSRKSFLDSDSDSLPSSDEEIKGRCKSKLRFCFSSSDDDSDDTFSVSSKSSVREEEAHVITDTDEISTTDEEDQIPAYKGRRPRGDKDGLTPKRPSVPRMDLEDILSDDDSPEESVEKLEKDQKGFGIGANPVRLLLKLAQPPGNTILPDSTVAAAAVVDSNKVKVEEVEEGEIEEDVYLQASTDKAMIKSEAVSNSGYTGYYQTPFSLEPVNDKSLIVPYDVVRRRGYKKSPKPLPFRPRLEHERLDLVYEFLKKGIDAEDIRYFQKAYETLLFDDTLNWLNCTHWVDHPETVIKNKLQKQKRQKRNDSGEGSLRTRGFVRMAREEKSRAMAGQQPAALMSYDGTLPSEKQKPADMGRVRETQTREARSNQRRLLTVLGTESDLLKFNQLYFRKKALRFARSGIHDWGLFAAEPIAADEMVIEYVGQMIRPVIADLRELSYEKQGIGSSYLFRIDLETIIDATRCGNLSRFINHSCNPNCYAKVITLEGKKKMVIYSKQPIAVNEEITYDYKFPIEDKKIPCLCGTPQCRGALN